MSVYELVTVVTYKILVSFIALSQSVAVFMCLHHWRLLVLLLMEVALCNGLYRGAWLLF